MNYIVGEKLLAMKDPAVTPEKIQMYSGLTALALTSVYIVVYTMPNFRELVSEKVEKANGNVTVIISLYAVLVITAFLHSWTYYKLLNFTGSVSTGILQSLRAIGVFMLSSWLYCAKHSEQCMNQSKIISAVVVVSGVLYFTLLKKNRRKSEQPVDV